MQGLSVLYALLLWTAGLGVLSVTHNIRVELLRSPEDLNDITLICRNNSVTLEAADFWVNSTDQPLTSILSNYSRGMAQIQFLLHPDIEGSYYCGIISAELVSSNNWTLVGMFVSLNMHMRCNNLLLCFISISSPKPKLF